MAGKDHVLPSGALACPLDLLLSIQILPSLVCLFCKTVDEKSEAKAARVQGLRTRARKYLRIHYMGRGDLGGRFVKQGSTGKARTNEAWCLAGQAP